MARARTKGKQNIIKYILFSAKQNKVTTQKIFYKKSGTFSDFWDFRALFCFGLYMEFHPKPLRVYTWGVAPTPTKTFFEKKVLDSKKLSIGVIFLSICTLHNVERTPPHQRGFVFPEFASIHSERGAFSLRRRCHPCSDG